MSSPPPSEPNPGRAENTSSVHNYATGHAIQFFVSTDNRTINGANIGLGPTSRQVAGYLSDEAVQQISGDLTKITLPNTGSESNSSQDKAPPIADDGKEHKIISEFRNRYGEGFKLTPNTT
jgi:hypothetical protein